MSAPTASASASSTSVGRFAGQIVLIAGGSQNLGRELAVAFAAAGARLSIFARTESELRETKKQCMQASKSTDEKDVLISVGDISIASDVARIVAATVSAFGRIDISINNACYDSQPNDTADVEPSEFAKVMDIGVNGTFHCMKYVIAAMLQQSASSSSTPDVSPAASSDLSPICVSSASRGIIINVASRYGHVAFPRWGPYCAAKHAVIGLTKTAAIEYATKGIRINAFSPGAISSGMIVKDLIADPSFAARLQSSIPVGRIGLASEFVAAIMFLASPEAAFFQGMALIMDGGFTAQ